MTKHTPKRRSYSRRSRQVSVTTKRRERTPELFARILTNTALGRAQLEAEARTEHLDRVTRSQSLARPGWLPEREGASDA